MPWNGFELSEPITINGKRNADCKIRDPKSLLERVLKLNQLKVWVGKWCIEFYDSKIKENVSMMGAVHTSALYELFVSLFQTRSHFGMRLDENGMHSLGFTVLTSP